MERAGIKVDADDLRRMSVDFEARMAVMEQDFHRLAGHPFNVGSPKQLGEVLFDEQKLPGGKRMKTGAWGTDSSVLQTLADQGHGAAGAHPGMAAVAEAEIDLRRLRWSNEINPETGRVHTSFAMAIASTGRLSSTDPNLQNIPIRTEEGSRIRHAFIAEPGHVLVSADYSQIELRLLAHVADIPALQGKLRQRRGHPCAHRQRGVRRADGGHGPDDAPARQGDQFRHHLRHQRASAWRGSWHRAGRGARLHRRVISRAIPASAPTWNGRRRRRGSTATCVSPFGRRCWIPGIADKNPARRAYAERQAINAPLQGGAADIIKRAMVKLPAALRAARACGRGCCCRCTTNCCSRRRRPRPRRWPLLPGR